MSYVNVLTLEVIWYIYTLTYDMYHMLYSWYYNWWKSNKDDYIGCNDVNWNNDIDESGDNDDNDNYQNENNHNNYMNVYLKNKKDKDDYQRKTTIAIICITFGVGIRNSNISWSVAIDNWSFIKRKHLIRHLLSCDDRPP